MTALYLLAAEYRAAAMQLADLDLDAQTVADTLEGMSGDLETKSISCAMVARNIEATAAAIKDAETAMATRRKALENRAASLRQYVLDNMLFSGIQRVECPQFRLAVKDNPPAVDIFDIAQVPAEFMTPAPPAPPPAPDRAAIKAAIKAGRDVAGCRITQGQRLEIK